MRNTNRIRKTAEDHVVNIFCVIIGVALALACIYPIYYTVINSLNDGADAAKGGIYLWPRIFSTGNYDLVFRSSDLPLSFLLTVLRTFIGTLLTLIFTTGVSYALSRSELIGRRVYLMIGMVTMYVSGGVIPSYMLFRNLKRNRQTMAVVVDEYGGMVGIVTIHDLMEALVGDLDNETAEDDSDTPHVEAVDGAWLVHGNVLLSTLEEALDCELISDSYDTFTGLIFDALSMVPPDGDAEIEVDCQGMHVVIHRIEGHQIEEAVVTKLTVEEDEDE